MSTPLYLSDMLISLEHDGKRLLMDGRHITPLVIDKGGDKVLEFLETCRTSKNRDSILQEWNDPQLLDALIAHGIIYQSHPSLTTTKSKSCTNCGSENCGAEEKFKPRGLSLYLLLTQYCNLACIYCLNGNETYRKSEHPIMEENVAFAAIEQGLESLSTGGMLDIIFFGGEPLMNWALAKAIILHCEQNLRPRYSDKNWKYHFTTNLTIFPDDLIEWVKRYKITFLVDIDGPEDIHNLLRPSINNKRNSFLQTTNNLSKLIDAGIEVALRTTVTRYNVEHMLEITQLHRDLGGSASAFVPLNPINSDEICFPSTLYPDPSRYSYNLEKVLNSGIWPLEKIHPANSFLNRIVPGAKQHIACGAPFGNTPVVDVEGDIYACIYLVGNPRFLLGNTF